MGSRKIADDLFVRAMEEMRFVPSRDKAFSSLSGVGLSSQKTYTVDLHGLTVEKARRLVEDILDNRSRLPAEVRIIVGQGTHSIGVHSPLRLAVESILEERGIRYTFIKGVILL